MAKNSKKNMNKREESESKIANFTYPKSLAERIDKVFPNYGFSSRAGFIKHAIHLLLEKYEAPSLKEGEQ